MIQKPSELGGLCFWERHQISRNLMQRVVIVGANGAGKTWLAQRLAIALDAPIIHKDALALTRGWQQRPRDEVQAALHEALQGPFWVLEGGPSILDEAVLAQATLVIWLDLPAKLRVWRIFWRSLQYLGRTRPEHPAGNRDWPGPRQARFLWRALLGGAGFRDAVLSGLAGRDVPIIRLTKARDVRAFLAHLP